MALARQLHSWILAFAARRCRECVRYKYCSIGGISVCSLNNTDALGNLTLLMTTDENDDKYRQDVLALSKNYNHDKIVDLDKITQEVIDAAITSGQVRKKLQNN